jgi:uncharacterized membrane protein
LLPNIVPNKLSQDRTDSDITLLATDGGFLDRQQIENFSIFVCYLIEPCHYYLQVATGQIASTGVVSLSYVQKVNEKVKILSIVAF